MIDQDLLNITVNELIKNYCVLYNHIQDEVEGIILIKDAERIDKEFGQRYTDEFDFIEIMGGAYNNLIEEQKILSYYEICELLQKYIGWMPNPKALDIVAECEHDRWVEWSGSVAQMMLDLITIIKKHQMPLDDDEIDTVKDIKNKIDKWHSTWISFEQCDDITKASDRQKAMTILKTLKDNNIDINKKGLFNLTNEQF